MCPVTPRPLLNSSVIAQQVSQYWRVSVVEVTGSTQEDLLQKVSDLTIQDGDVLATEFQRSGRGRLDRTFEADASTALMLSLYISPQVDRSEWSFIPLIAGLSAAHAISHINPEIDISLKWPNDLLIGAKKCGGIIAQAVAQGIVVGIGINVEMSKEQLPVSHATSLAIEGARVLDRNQLAAALLNSFADLHQRWEAGEDLLHLYKEKCATLGREVEVHLPDGTQITDAAIDISKVGELVLRSGTRITSADVIHLR